MNQIIEKPVFLVGCMRSGTSLTARLLGAHPNIIRCVFELRRVWSRVGNVPMASPKTRDRTCPHLTEEDVQPGQAESLSRAFLNEMKKNKQDKNLENAIFLNKNPHLSNKLPFVNALFPDARFIWIYRNLPSVTASLPNVLNQKIFHYWPEKDNEETVRCFECFFTIPKGVDRNRCFPGGDVKYLAEYWYETNRAISDFSKSISQDRILIIKEEDLIKYPESVIEKCHNFLELPNILPKELIATIDRNRNELWDKRLNSTELKSLLDFVVECGTNLDSIFPDEELFEHYKEQILFHL